MKQRGDRGFRAGADTAVPELTAKAIRRPRRVYGVSVNAVRDWEQGRHQPRAAQRRELEALLRTLLAEQDNGVGEQ